MFANKDEVLSVAYDNGKPIIINHILGIGENRYADILGEDGLVRHLNLAAREHAELAAAYSRAVTVVNEFGWARIEQVIATASRIACLKDRYESGNLSGNVLVIATFNYRRLNTADRYILEGVGLGSLLDKVAEIMVWINSLELEGELND